VGGRDRPPLSRPFRISAVERQSRRRDRLFRDARSARRAAPAFNGKLSEEGKTISGELKQGGATMPFKIERKGEAKLTASAAPAAGKAGPAPKIEGSWEGVLDVGGTTLRLIVKIAKAADGGLTATLDSPDQGRSDMPITSITATETDVRFDLKYLGAYFEGKLNKELSEMTGDWYQGGASIPLVLKRAK
jgi:hypothetical protein